jgi:polyisoprenoid-binding protein YceI
MGKPAETPKAAAASGQEKSPADAKLDKAGAAKPAAPPPAAAAAALTNGKNVEWTVDPTHSQIGFVAKHLGFTKVNGQFKKFTASAHGDPKTAKLTALEATADTGSIDTGNEKRDKHLKGEDFFNADKFPQLKLVAKSFKWNGNKFTATVDLTIRDVTKPVTFKGELLGVHKVNFGQGEQLRAGYEGSATINRKDFGLTWSMVTEGIAVVADPVQIELAAELSYVPPPSAASTSAPTTPTASK